MSSYLVSCNLGESLSDILGEILSAILGESLSESLGESGSLSEAGCRLRELLKEVEDGRNVDLVDDSPGIVRSGTFPPRRMVERGLIMSRVL